jgi:hypothetical protein
MKKWILWILVTLIVIIIYHVCYNLTSLHPSNIDWLMTARHDWGTHYLGWAFYKNEPWHFPLGKVTGYNYPVGTNVGFTDSIPLMAIFFKIFSGWLTDDFQYFGLFLFLCHLLAAYFTVLLCKLFKVNTIATLVAVVFVATNPVLVYRGMHPALCAQWLLIACIYFYFLNPDTVRPKKILLYQLILLLLSALINPYLCWMVLGFTLATPVKLCFFDKAIEKKYFFGYLAVSAILLMLVWYLTGMIDFGKKEDLGVGGAYGLYALNLNSLYNSRGYSPILPLFDWVSWHQYEGFMYLGFGMLILVFILLLYYGYVFIKRQGKGSTTFRKISNKNIPLIVLVALYTIFSVTLVFTLNGKVLFRIPAPSFFVQLVEIFRANARFFWMPYYLIILFTIIGLAKSKLKPVFVSVLIIGAMFIQLYDIKSLLTSRRDMTNSTYTPPMDNQTWLKIMSQFDEILFYPAFESPKIRSMDYQDFSFLALKAGKPVNLAYVARADSRAMQSFGDSLTAMVETGKLSPKALYIINAPYLEHFSVAFQLNAARLNTLDGCYFIFSSSLKNEMLNALVNKGNLAGKTKLDSALGTVGNRTEFSKTEKIPVHDDSIRYHPESIHISEQVISMQGWAFIVSTQNNKGDSIFVMLNSNNKSYIASAQMFQRPDINAYFGRTNLDNGGFKFLAFTDDVERGTYQVVLAIKDARGRFVYQRMGEEVRVKIPEYETPKKTAQLPAIGKINYDIVVQETESEFSADGWAAIENQDADYCTIKLVLKNDNNTYVCDTHENLRPDVTNSFKYKYKLDSSGYTIKILKGTMEKGKYRLGILIKDNKRNAETMILADKEINVK